MTKQKSVVVVDPINGKRLTVRSIYVPEKTLLQGKDVSLHSNHILKPQPQFKRGPWRG